MISFEINASIGIVNVFVTFIGLIVAWSVGKMIDCAYKAMCNETMVNENKQNLFSDTNFGMAKEAYERIMYQRKAEREKRMVCRDVDEEIYMDEEDDKSLMIRNKLKRSKAYKKRCISEKDRISMNFLYPIIMGIMIIIAENVLAGSISRKEINCVEKVNGTTYGKGTITDERMLEIAYEGTMKRIMNDEYDFDYKIEQNAKSMIEVEKETEIKGRKIETMILESQDCISVGEMEIVKRISCDEKEKDVLKFKIESKMIEVDDGKFEKYDDKNVMLKEYIEENMNKNECEINYKEQRGEQNTISCYRNNKEKFYISDTEMKKIGQRNVNESWKVMVSTYEVSGNAGNAPFYFRELARSITRDMKNNVRKGARKVEMMVLMTKGEMKSFENECNEGTEVEIGVYVVMNIAMIVSAMIILFRFRKHYWIINNIGSYNANNIAIREIFTRTNCTQIDKFQNHAFQYGLVEYGENQHLTWTDNKSRRNDAKEIKGKDKVKERKDEDEMSIYGRICDKECKKLIKSEIMCWLNVLTEKINYNNNKRQVLKDIIMMIQKFQFKTTVYDLIAICMIYKECTIKGMDLVNIAKVCYAMMERMLVYNRGKRTSVMLPKKGIGRCSRQYKKMKEAMGNAEYLSSAVGFYSQYCKKIAKSMKKNKVFFSIEEGFTSKKASIEGSKISEMIEKTMVKEKMNEYSANVSVVRELCKNRNKNKLFGKYSCISNIIKFTGKVEVECDVPMYYPGFIRVLKGRKISHATDKGGIKVYSGTEAIGMDDDGAYEDFSGGMEQDDGIDVFTYGMDTDEAHGFDEDATMYDKMHDSLMDDYESNMLMNQAMNEEGTKMIGAGQKMLKTGYIVTTAEAMDVVEQVVKRLKTVNENIEKSKYVIVTIDKDGKKEKGYVCDLIDVLSLVIYAISTWDTGIIRMMDSSKGMNKLMVMALNLFCNKIKTTSKIAIPVSLLKAEDDEFYEWLGSIRRIRDGKFKVICKEGKLCGIPEIDTVEDLKVAQIWCDAIKNIIGVSGEELLAAGETSYVRISMLANSKIEKVFKEIYAHKNEVVINREEKVVLSNQLREMLNRYVVIKNARYSAESVEKMCETKEEKASEKKETKRIESSIIDSTGMYGFGRGTQFSQMSSVYASPMMAAMNPMMSMMYGGVNPFTEMMRQHIGGGQGKLYEAQCKSRKLLEYKMKEKAEREMDEIEEIMTQNRLKKMGIYVEEVNEYVKNRKEKEESEKKQSQMDENVEEEDTEEDKDVQRETTGEESKEGKEMVNIGHSSKSMISQNYKEQDSASSVGYVSLNSEGSRRRMQEIVEEEEMKNIEPINQIFTKCKVVITSGKGVKKNLKEYDYNKIEEANSMTIHGEYLKNKEGIIMMSEMHKICIDLIDGKIKKSFYNGKETQGNLHRLALGETDIRVYFKDVCTRNYKKDKEIRVCKGQ